MKKLSKKQNFDELFIHFIISKLFLLRLFLLNGHVVLLNIL